MVSNNELQIDNDIEKKHVIIMWCGTTWIANANGRIQSSTFVALNQIWKERADHSVIRQMKDKCQVQRAIQECDGNHIGTLVVLNS
jgi:hypothetical protein